MHPENDPSLTGKEFLVSDNDEEREEEIKEETTGKRES